VNKRAVIIGIFGVFALGFLAGHLERQYVAAADRYTIQIMNVSTALKIDKQTGDTWTFDRFHNVWTHSPNQTSTPPLPSIKNTDGPWLKYQNSN
jgi:hypothetical protein